MKKNWFQTARHRNVVDMHITDHRPEFLSKLNADEYVNMLKLSHSQSAVFYMQSHVGLSNWETDSGKQHPGLAGRNVMREIIDKCHENDINVVFYYSLFFNVWAYNKYPDWRIVTLDGTWRSEGSRYGLCCPNCPEFRDFTVKQIQEMCRFHDCEGFRFDMTSWPTVCYCRHCQERFAKEVGGAIPRKIDWDSAAWVRFQRRREAWMTEFARLCTDTVKAFNPDLSVEHQSSVYPMRWELGNAWHMADCSDFMQGDFYGDRLQSSLACKIFYNMTNNHLFGFETSAAGDLSNFTVIKTPEHLTCKMFNALANGGAFVFIDSIDPVGTMNQAVYRRMGSVSEKTEPYEPYLKGTMCQEVGLYLSTESKYEPDDENGKPGIYYAPGTPPHVDGLVKTTQAMMQRHIPFGILTHRNLENLAHYKCIWLSNAMMMDDEEVAAFREYVRRGGCLIATKGTSYRRSDGETIDNFLLADVFGVDLAGETDMKFTYIVPEGDMLPVFGYFDHDHPLGLADRQMRVKARPGARVLGHLALPYTDPNDPAQFTSIHNNPVGIHTEHPAIVYHEYGQGRCLYVSGAYERMEAHGDIAARMVDYLVESSWLVETNAPPQVEVLVFHDEPNNLYNLRLLNFQKELPNIPVRDITVGLRLDGRKAVGVRLAPDGEEVSFKNRDGRVWLTFPEFETFALAEIVYE